MTALIAALLAVAAAPPEVETLFKEIQARRAHVETVEAAFTEQSFLPGEVLSTAGNLLYARPRRILYHTQDPDRTTLVDRNMGYEYEPELKQLMIYDLAEFPQIDAFFLGFHDDLETLRASYNVTAFAIRNDPVGSVGIRLEPKPELADDAFFLAAEVYLRDEDYLPYRFVLDNEEDSRTVILVDVDTLSVNGNPPPEKTQIEVAEGTDVIMNNEVIRTVGAGGERLPDPVVLEQALPAPAAPETPE